MRELGALHGYLSWLLQFNQPACLCISLYICVSTRLFPGIFVECIVVPQRSLFDKVLFSTLQQLISEEF